MKTVREQVENWLNANTDGWTETQLEKIESLILEIDQDMRNACRRHIGETDLSGCEAQGAWSFCAGIGRDQCPYLYPSEEYSAWMHGWCDASTDEALNKQD